MVEIIPNLSSVVLIDSETGIIVYGSQSVEQSSSLKSYINENNTVVHPRLNVYFNATLSLVKTNFLISFHSVSYYPYIVAGTIVVIIALVIAFLIFRSKDRKSRFRQI